MKRFLLKRIVFLLFAAFIISVSCSCASVQNPPPATTLEAGKTSTTTPQSQSTITTHKATAKPPVITTTSKPESTPDTPVEKPEEYFRPDISEVIPPEEMGEGDLLYQIYPDTFDAPSLELYWPDLSMDNIARFTPYGIWESPYEPATEMQFYTFTYHDPVYSPCAGTVVNIMSGPDPTTGNIACSVTIRYGRNYSVTLHHVADILPVIKLGFKVEARTLIGYTQNQMGVGWWEIDVVTRTGEIVRTMPPYELFSPESQKILDEILIAAKKHESSPYSTWTVVTTNIPSDLSKGQGSWIQDFGGITGWWAANDRIGLRSAGETLTDFLIANNKENLVPLLTGGPGQPLK